MSKMKIIKFGDERGVGSIVEVVGLFGRVRTWTLVPKLQGDGTIEKYWGLDKWTCRETGAYEFRNICEICHFYSAQYKTKDDA